MRPTNAQQFATSLDEVSAIKEESSSTKKPGLELLWLSENIKAISEVNDYIDRNGLPLAKYCLF